MGLLTKIVRGRSDKGKSTERSIHKDYPTKLPPNLRIEALIDISNTAFNSYGDHINIEYPGKTHIVKKLSAFRSYGLYVIRAYIQSLDSEEESIVQFNCKYESGEFDVLDTILFRVDGTFHPETEEEWAEWTNETNGMIGYKTLNFSMEGGEIVFNRDWDIDGGQWVRTVELREAVFTDPYEAPLYRMRNAMLYSKEIDGSDEYEYALAEVVKDEDGDRVEMSFGIIVESTNINIH